MVFEATGGRVGQATADTFMLSVSGEGGVDMSAVTWSAQYAPSGVQVGSTPQPKPQTSIPQRRDPVPAVSAHTFTP